MWPFSLFKPKPKPDDAWAEIERQEREHPDEVVEQYGRNLGTYDFSAEAIAAMKAALRREIVEGRDTTDYLGNAAELGHRAAAATKAGKYDEAWRLYHEQKEQYVGHARRYGMTARQTVSLDASVHAQLANIRRLEGKHCDALTHLLYCVVSGDGPSTAQTKKVVAYFNRCHFASTTIDQLRDVLEQLRKRPDLMAIRAIVERWKESK